MPAKGLDEALTYTAFPSSHHKYIRTRSGLERLFREVKRRTRVVGVFPNERSAENLSTVVLLRVSEEGARRRRLDMNPLNALFHQPTTFATLSERTEPPTQGGNSSYDLNASITYL